MTGFWSSETMRARFRSDRWVTPFDPKRIENCAYALSMGPQALLTGEDKIRYELDEREEFRIPPGQFAQLLTEEVVRVPADALGLISMKSQIKTLGLVNVSGFHVDPGYQGRLRFSVYNAGPAPVRISRGTPTFLIWFAALDKPTSDTYAGQGRRHEFLDRDTKDMQGDVHTPQVLANRVLKLESTVSWRHQLGNLVLAAILGGLATFGFGALASCDEPDSSSSREDSSAPTGSVAYLAS